MLRLFDGHGATASDGNFTASGLPFNSILNSEGTDGRTDVLFGLYFYTKANNPMQISTPKPITYISPKVVNSNSHSVYQGALLTNSITDGIATSNELVKFESKVLENDGFGADYELAVGNTYTIVKGYTTFRLMQDVDDGHLKKGDIVSYYPGGVQVWTAHYSLDSGWQLASRNISNISNNAPTLTSSTSKASKSFYSKAVDGTKHYDMIFGQEIVDGADSGVFDNLRNGTTVDFDGNTVNTKVLAVQTQYRK